MDKKLDWNSAYSNDETTRAVLDSEIFRNYAMREMAKEKFVLPLHVPSGTLIDRRYVDSALEEALSYPENSRERAAFLGYYKKLKFRLEQQEEIDSSAKVASDKKLEEANKKKFKKDTDNIMNKVEKAEDASKVPEPIIPNLPYDGDTYQEHVERVHDANEKGKNTYKEFYPDYKVYHKGEEEVDLLKIALDEILSNAPEEKPTQDETTPTIQPTTPKTEHKPAKSDTVNYDKLYNTGAGAKSSVEVGMTKETERLMDAGIDYVDTGKATPKAVPVKEVVAPIKEDAIEEFKPEQTEPVNEIKEAEVALGLDKNIFYILRKMGK